jgi:hypothetical protein
MSIRTMMRFSGYMRAIVGLLLFLTIPHVAPCQSLPFELAGKYYRGDGLGDQAALTLETDSVFILSRSFDDAGSSVTRDSGEYSVVRGHIVLFPNWPNSVEYAAGVHTHFVPIRWGTRDYLVPDELMADFCNEVNLGFEPRDWVNGTFFLRESDWGKSVEGFPDLPGDWNSYMLPRPLNGEIVKNLGQGKARVNLGSSQSLCAGMVLVLQWDDVKDYMLMNKIVRVVDVESDSCTIRSDQPKSIWLGRKVTSRFRPME